MKYICVCLSNFAACKLDTYKSGERTCSPCPLHSHTNEPAQMKSGCICDDGYSGPPGGPCEDVDECATNSHKGRHGISWKVIKYVSVMCHLMTMQLLSL